MAYSQADLDALDRAIATGAREVEFGAGPDRRRTVFRSLDEMRSIRADIAAQVSPAGVTPRVTFAEHIRD